MKLPNLFAEMGKTPVQTDEKLRAAFDAIFADPEERFYFENDGDHGFLMDTGNRDARTEGMSYGMMMAVQMDRQDLFDRLWRFSWDFMRQRAGRYEGYFAWSVRPDGRHNAEGPAPDGEEYFAMALLFAEARWGGRETPFDYAARAREILRRCVHQDALAAGGRAMWDPENKLIRFVPEADFSDPSYHLPHFYALFADACDPEDAAFWRAAAAASRDYIARAAHPVTGLSPEYAEYDGAPRRMFGKAMAFFSDAYRVGLNIGLDAAWNGPTPALSALADRLQGFLLSRPDLLETACQLDGAPEGTPVMHPLGLLATTAAASVAARGDGRRAWAERLWNAEPRRGARRYYDNCLYFFSLLTLSGRYVNWLDGAGGRDA